MKNIFYCILIALAVPCIILTANNKKNNSGKVVVAYVTSWTEEIPDPAIVTHINYAFGHVNNTFDGVRIDNPQRLKQVLALKKTNNDLKVLLSVGGWGSGRFSEMAGDAKLRKSFANNCAEIVKEFNLDGIDIDWEYPTSNAAGISAAPEDTKNFTLLMQDIRKAIGKKKLLTLATVLTAQYIDFVEVNKVADFVNIMAYDGDRPPKHHAALYRSEMTGGTSCAEAVEAHIRAGMPAEKLVLGIPFYGRGNKKEVKDFVDFKNIPQLTGVESRWDDIAKAAYLVNKDGVMVCTYETPESIKLKCDMIKEKGLLGAMYWEFAGDDGQGTLSKLVYNEVMNKK